MNEAADPTSDQPDSVYPLAKRRWRLVAQILDGLLAMIAALPVILYFDIWATVKAGEQPEPHIMAIAFVWGVLTFVAMNYWLLENKGQTIGKWCVDVAIVGLDGQKKSALHLLTQRYLPWWVAGQIPLIGQLLITVDSTFILGSERRCIHDRIAGTKVINIES